jgi:hypothetical protein
MVNYSAKISTSGGLPWNYIMSPKTTNQEPGVVVYSLIPALRWLRQENGEFETSLSYIMRLCPEDHGSRPAQAKC